MKKKKLIPIMIAVVLLIAATTYYLMPKTFGKGINPEAVDHIDVFDGNTGAKFTVDDPDDIKYIVENIKSKTMKKAGISLGRMGYRFSVVYADSNGKAILPEFNNKSSGKLLYCKSKQNIGFKESFVAGAGLLALPIVRWLNSYFINKSILNNCLILFLAVWIAYFLAKVIFERVYSEICVSDFRISDSKYANFLEAAKKNASIAMSVFALSVICSILLSIIYIFSSRFIMIFLGVIVMFISFLMNFTDIKERQHIINALINSLNHE